MDEIAINNKNTLVFKYPILLFIKSSASKIVIMQK